MNNEDFWKSINIGAADDLSQIPRLFRRAKRKGLDILTVRRCNGLMTYRSKEPDMSCVLCLTGRDVGLPYGSRIVETPLKNLFSLMLRYETDGIAILTSDELLVFPIESFRFGRIKRQVIRIVSKLRAHYGRELAVTGLS